MNVLIGGEVSGIIREAFLARGHFAVSADLLPAPPGSDPHELHYHGDMWEVIREPWRMLPGGRGHCGQWDLLIAHPECTYLTNSAAWAYKSGPYHQNVKPGTLTGAARQRARAAAYEFFMGLWNCDTPRIALENPVGIMSTLWRKPDQIIQPYQFGEDASKATCLWLKDLPLLRPTQRIPGRLVNGRERWANQTDSGQNRLAPGPQRAGARAQTYPGIAAAMANQWG